MREHKTISIADQIFEQLERDILTGKYQRDHADWAIANRLDVDIMRGCFDTTDLKRHHDGIAPSLTLRTS